MPRIGLISDTHGLLRPEAVAFLRGSDFIVHAGDIGDAGVLRELKALAPVTVVRGNGPWAEAIAETEVLRVGDVSLYVLHNLAELDLDPVISWIPSRIDRPTLFLSRRNGPSPLRSDLQAARISAG